MSETMDIKRRLSLIQIASMVLRPDMPGMEFQELTGLIEALCRHKELPIELCLSPPRHQILSKSDDYRKWVEFEMPETS